MRISQDFPSFWPRLTELVENSFKGDVAQLWWDTSVGLQREEQWDTAGCRASSCGVKLVDLNQLLVNQGPLLWKRGTVSLQRVAVKERDA